MTEQNYGLVVRMPLSRHTECDGVNARQMCYLLAVTKRSGSGAEKEHFPGVTLNFDL